MQLDIRVLVRLMPSSVAVKNVQSHIKCLQDLAGQAQLYLLLMRQRLRDRHPYLEDGGTTATDILT